MLSRPDNLIHMSGLVIATGNPSRRDDGVAHAVLALFRPGPGVRLRRALQLTPELAGEMAGYESVVFIDADLTAARITIEPVIESDLSPALTHASSAPEIVVLSRTLFGFAGSALLCRLPVDDLSFGEGLSPRAKESAGLAVSELGRWSERYLRRQGVTTQLSSRLAESTPLASKSLPEQARKAVLTPAGRWPSVSAGDT